MSGWWLEWKVHKLMLASTVVREAIPTYVTCVVAKVIHEESSSFNASICI